MNNAEFTKAVYEISGTAIKDGMGYSQAYADICALVKAEAQPQADNTGSPKLPPSCDKCILRGICYVSPGYKTTLCIDVWRQLRAGA